MEEAYLTSGDDNDVPMEEVYITSGDGNDDDLSITSGFELLAIDGTTMMKCLRCTFFNAQSSRTCEMCHAALVANPFQTVDFQLARNVQVREENAKQVRTQNDTGKSSAPTLQDTSHILVNRLLALSESADNTPGISFYHLEAALGHVTRFLQRSNLDRKGKDGIGKLYTGFAFTDKNMVSRNDMNDVVSSSFFISDSAAVAYEAFRDQDRTEDGYPASLAVPVAPCNTSEKLSPCTGWVCLLQPLEPEEDASTKIVRVNYHDKSHTFHFLQKNTSLCFLPVLSFDSLYFSGMEFLRLQHCDMVPGISKVLEATFDRFLLLNSNFISDMIRPKIKPFCAHEMIKTFVPTLQKELEDLIKVIVVAFRSVGVANSGSCLSVDVKTRHWVDLTEKEPDSTCNPHSLTTYLYSCSNFSTKNFRVLTNLDKSIVQIHRVQVGSNEVQSHYVWKSRISRMHLPILNNN